MQWCRTGVCVVACAYHLQSTCGRGLLPCRVQEADAEGPPLRLRLIAGRGRDVGVPIPAPTQYHAVAPPGTCTCGQLRQARVALPTDLKLFL